MDEFVEDLENRKSTLLEINIRLLERSVAFANTSKSIYNCRHEIMEQYV